MTFGAPILTRFRALADQKRHVRNRRRARIGRTPFLALGIERLEPRHMLSAVSWTGTSTGGDGVNWSDPKNWSTNALPGAADDVTINPTLPPNTTLTIIHASGSDTINSLNSPNSQVNLNLSGGSLDVLNGGTLSGSFTNSAALNVDGAGFLLAGGVSSVGGRFTVAAGADLELDGPVSLDAASSVTGAGDVGIGGNSCTLDGVFDVGGGTGVGGSVTFLQPFTTASGNSLGAFLTVGASVAATATFAEGGDFTLQQLTLDSGTLIGPTDSSASPMQITVTDPGSPSGGLFSVSASGEFQGRGTLTVAADASTQIDAITFQLDGWTLDDSGPATVSGDTMTGRIARRLPVDQSGNAGDQHRLLPRGNWIIYQRRHI